MSHLQTSTVMKLQFGNLEITPSVEARLEELGFTPTSLQEAVNDHKSGLDGEPSVYCGSYHKYNCGSLQGLWVNLASFSDFDEFITFCQAIHADESDVELMAQDYDSFPREWYNEGFILEEDFDKILQYAELCEKHSAEAVDAFVDWGCEDLDHFEDCYVGEYDSEEDYAEQFIAEVYDLQRLMGGLSSYFDYSRFARDLFMDDYYYDNGHVFRRY